MTRRSLIAEHVSKLEEAAIEDARRNVEWMVEEVLGISRAELYAHLDVGVTDGERERLESMTDRRVNREPLQYILGYTEFRGIHLNVNRAVLIPRPETEVVVEEALRRIEGIEQPWVLDIGTGSGAIALAIKHARPDAEIIACDVSQEALEVAAENARLHNLDVAFVSADVRDPGFAEGVARVFDLVVSNPPYVLENERGDLQPEVKAHEPNVALFVPTDDPLLFYRLIAEHLPQLLRPGCWCVVETHSDHGKHVATLFESTGMADVTVLPDLAGRQRIVSSRSPT